MCHHFYLHSAMIATPVQMQERKKKENVVLSMVSVLILPLS